MKPQHNSKRDKDGKPLKLNIREGDSLEINRPPPRRNKGVLEKDKETPPVEFLVRAY
jgi:hypothetical protein